MRNEPSNHPVLPLSTRMVFLHNNLSRHDRHSAHVRRQEEQSALSFTSWGLLLFVPLLVTALLLGSLYA